MKICHHYLVVSEQTPSVVALGVLTTETHVECSETYKFNYCDAIKETISQLEKNIKTCKSITTMLSEGKTPEEKIDIVFRRITTPEY